jgi:hypothetical protein
MSAARRPPKIANAGIDAIPLCKVCLNLHFSLIAPVDGSISCPSPLKPGLSSSTLSRL